MDVMNIKLLALTKYSSKGASSRERFMIYYSHLKNAGVYVQNNALLPDEYLEKKYKNEKIPKNFILRMYWIRFKSMLAARSYQATWIQYEALPYLPFFVENLFKLYKNKIIVDYDDAMFHIYDQNKNFLVRFFLKNKIKNVMRSAHTVIVGNNYLEEYAKKSGAKKIVRIPTIVDTEIYIPKTIKSTKKSIIIGWLGSPSTQYYLSVVRKAIIRLTKERDIEFHAMGTSVDFRIQGINIIKHDWSEEKQLEFLNTIDIGIMPLIAEPFTKGKCGYKLLQYMAYEKPVLATPIGANVEIVKNNVNGFLCTSDDQWFQNLKKLSSDEALRRTLGKKGREIVETKYSLKENEKILFSCFSD